MSSTTRKIYYVIRNCRKTLQSLKMQGFELIVFTALLYQNGKKLSSIEKANTEYFAELMRSYDKSEEPDKVKVEFRNSENNSLLWSKAFLLSDARHKPILPNNPSTGLGKAEIDEIIGRKIADYRQVKEAELLSTQVEELRAENEGLKGELKVAKARLDAKKQMEYYAGLLGIALPVITSAIGKIQAKTASNALSGAPDGMPKAKTAKFSDHKASIIQLINEHMQSLEDPLLEKLFLHVCEFDRRKPL